MAKNCRSACLFFLLVLPFFSPAQKLKVSRYDAAMKQWHFETVPVNVKSAPTAKMSVMFKAIDTTVYLQLKGSGVGTSTVDKDDQVILTLDNNVQVKGHSQKLQAIEYGESLPSYQHEYVLSVKDMELLSKHSIVSVRKFAVGAFEDITLEKKNSLSVKQSGAVLLEALKKEKLLAPKSALSFAPGFPGGKEVYLQFLNRNFKLPSQARQKTEVAVKVKFTVLKDGTVTGFQIQAPAQTGIDQELQRILNRMPRWKPGFENNQVATKQVEHTLRIVTTESEAKIFL